VHFNDCDDLKLLSSGIERDVYHFARYADRGERSCYAFDERATLFIKHQSSAGLGCRVRVYLYNGTSETLISNLPMLNVEAQLNFGGPFDDIRVTAQQLGAGGGDDTVFGQVSARAESSDVCGGSS